MTEWPLQAAVQPRRRSCLPRAIPLRCVRLGQKTLRGQAASTALHNPSHHSSVSAAVKCLGFPPEILDCCPSLLTRGKMTISPHCIHRGAVSSQQFQRDLLSLTCRYKSCDTFVWRKLWDWGKQASSLQRSWVCSSPSSALVTVLRKVTDLEAPAIQGNSAHASSWIDSSSGNGSRALHAALRGHRALGRPHAARFSFPV